MKANEMKRLLQRLGASFREGRNHTIVFLGGKKTTLPRHPSTELASATLYSMLKDLNISLHDLRRGSRSQRCAPSK